VRFSAGDDSLAQLVRKDQDLTAEAKNLDEAIIAAVSKVPSRRDAAAEQKRIKDRITAIAKGRHDLEITLDREFPDYAALSHACGDTYVQPFGRVIPVISDTPQGMAWSSDSHRRRSLR
jgi:hypothetical protein